LFFYFSINNCIKVYYVISSAAITTLQIFLDDDDDESKNASQMRQVRTNKPFLNMRTTCSHEQPHRSQNLELYNPTYTTTHSDRCFGATTESSLFKIGF